MVFVSRLHAHSCIGIVQHPQYQDRSDQAQQDEITRASGEGIGLFGEAGNHIYAGCVNRAGAISSTA